MKEGRVLSPHVGLLDGYLKPYSYLQFGDDFLFCGETLDEVSTRIWRTSWHLCGGWANNLILRNGWIPLTYRLVACCHRTFREIHI